MRRVKLMQDSFTADKKNNNEKEFVDFPSGIKMKQNVLVLLHI